MSTHIMLDLETMGNTPTSAIVAIGAVEFDPVLDTCGAEFYQLVDLESSMAAGLTVSANTVMWWMQQSEAARKAICAPAGSPLPSALISFRDWYLELADTRTCVWGNGSDFDNVILANAYRAVGLNPPWPFWSNRCYRTMKSLHPQVELVRVGEHHNALDDAKSQAGHLMAIMRGARGHG